MMKKLEDGEIIESYLSDHCNLICSLADSTLLDVLTRLFSNTITIGEAKILHEKKEQVKKLCCTAGPEFKSEAVEVKLKDILDDLKAFEDCRNLIAPLCEDLSSANLKIHGN